MTATIRGGADLQRFLDALPRNLEEKVLRGALRAGAEVIAAEAAHLTRSAEVAASITVTSSKEPGVISSKVQTKGPGAYIAPWLEYGTDPHFISVDSEQSGGRTIKRINTMVRRGSLVIGGKFVGATVHHPGARAHPFMRPAIDGGERAAIDAMGSYIRGHLTRDGLDGPAPNLGSEE